MIRIEAIIWVFRRAQDQSPKPRKGDCAKCRNIMNAAPQKEKRKRVAKAARHPWFRLIAAHQKLYLSANCPMRGPAPFSPVMVPNVVLLLKGLFTAGLFKMVWFKMSKYSMRNSRLLSR